MPRGVSKEKQELISGKGCYPFLTERDDTKKKLIICNKLLDSLMKTRSNNKIRRDKYTTEIRNCFLKLCIQSTDLLETRTKLEETKKDLSRQSRKRAALQDRVIELEFQNTKYSEYKVRFEEQLEVCKNSEQYYGELLRENDSLREGIKALKNQKQNSEKGSS